MRGSLEGREESTVWPAECRVFAYVGDGLPMEQTRRGLSGGRPFGGIVIVVGEVIRRNGEAVGGGVSGWMGDLLRALGELFGGVDFFLGEAERLESTAGERSSEEEEELNAFLDFRNLRAAALEIG